jgi:hypothetical protein
MSWDRQAPVPDDDQQRYDHETQEQPMPSIDDVFSGDSLKAADIQGREPTVTIKTVDLKEFTSKEGKPQKKLVLSFENAKKTLICNKTNAQRISYLHGKDYTRWPGKQITLFVDPFVQFGGEMTPAIRVKPPTYAQPAPQGPQSPDELLPVNEPIRQQPAPARFEDDSEIPF